MTGACRLLIAPDKFKGSMTATEVAQALHSGVVRGGASAQSLPLADGGDGSVAAAAAAGYGVRPAVVTDAVGRHHQAEYALRGSTAVVEVANTCGVALLGQRPDRATAMSASSRGFGQAVRAAVEGGARKVVLALGGSASTDGGAGFLEGLGGRLLDAHGDPVRPGGSGLLELAEVDLSGLDYLAAVELVVASDVTAPLLGPAGAASVFAPQKGASGPDLPVLEQALGRFAALLEAATGSDDLTQIAGTGSAGGIGHAAAVIGARMASGADLFLDLVGFDESVGQCDAIVSGEGSLDDQTMMGKLPAVVAQRSQGRQVHLAVGKDMRGTASRSRSPFASVRALADMTSRNTLDDRELTHRLLAEIGEVIARTVSGSAPPPKSSATATPDCGR